MRETHKRRSLREARGLISSSVSFYSAIFYVFLPAYFNLLTSGPDTVKA